MVAVTTKSRIEVSDSMMPRSDAGRVSWVKRIVKLAAIPPGTGGAAIESMMQITTAVIYQAIDTSVPLLSATLVAANRNSIGTPGLYRICPKGTPKLARR